MNDSLEPVVRCWSGCELEGGPGEEKKPRGRGRTDLGLQHGDPKADFPRHMLRSLNLSLFQTLIYLAGVSYCEKVPAGFSTVHSKQE
jgi:hypothetical protein